jgi:hypothetical protein
MNYERRDGGESATLLNILIKRTRIISAVTVTHIHDLLDISPPKTIDDGMDQWHG